MVYHVRSQKRPVRPWSPVMVAFQGSHLPDACFFVFPKTSLCSRLAPLIYSYQLLYKPWKELYLADTHEGPPDLLLLQVPFCMFFHQSTDSTDTQAMAKELPNQLS